MQPVTPAKARQDVLSALESGLDLRIALVPASTRLVFITTPAALTDPAAPVEPSTHASRNFLEFYEWLASTRRYLATLGDVGDRNVDTCLAILLCKVDNRLKSLAEMMRQQWEVEKVEAGLYGLASKQDAGPVVYDPCKKLKSPSPNTVMLTMALSSFLQVSG